MSAVFVTGGGGFVGRRVLAALRQRAHTVVALQHTSPVGLDDPGITVVHGSLLDPASYVQALRSCDTVLHLAAATGKAAASEHARVNAEGTAHLVDACREAGVRRFLLVSSIATTFTRREDYPYADAKIEAERFVRESGLGWLTVRPTMVLGPGSPILQSLAKLAHLPVGVALGVRPVQVQPIHVDDLAAFLADAVEHDWFDGRVVDAGGPDVVSMAALIGAIRASAGRSSGPVVRVPLPPIRAALRMAAAAGLGERLPVTVGQLSSFDNDGVVVSAPPSTWRPSRGLATMVAPAAAVTPEVRPDSAAEDSSLDRECRVFTRHVLGVEPDVYVRAQYRAAHRAVPSLAPSTGAFDTALVRIARLSPFFAALADGYAVLFLPACRLRRKLVMLAAILESYGPTSRRIDAPVDGRWRAALYLVGAGLRGVGFALLGAVVLTPVRLALSFPFRGKR